MKDAVDIYVRILIAIVGFFVPTINMVISSLLEKFVQRWRTADKLLKDANECLKNTDRISEDLIAKGITKENATNIIEGLKSNAAKDIVENTEIKELLSFFTVKGQYKAHIANLFTQFVFSLVFVAVFYLIDKQVFYMCDIAIQRFIFLTVSGLFLLLFLFAAYKNRNLVNGTNLIVEKAQVPYALFALLAFISLWLTDVCLTKGVNPTFFMLGEVVILLFSLIFAILGVENLRKITWKVVDILQSENWAIQDSKPANS